MRPIKLTMTAFGPYKDIEIVDFRELESRNLFLITGPTGSGKTTIFDAISFAIYGEASGEMRTAESLRSQFSNDELLTEVKLEFELKGIKYHIHRIPKQTRPKAKSEGFTEQKSEAILTIYDGEPKTIVYGVKNVNDKIESVIGINSEQFKQIMMIPQGEFQKLLTSSSEDRERVLKQLFDTSIYNTIQMKLDMQAKSLHNDIKRKKEIRDHEISRIECLDQEKLTELINADDKLVDEIVVLTREQIKKDEEHSKNLEEEIKELGKKLQKQIEDKQKAIENNEKLKQRENIKIKLAEKELLTPAINKLNNRVKRAERAKIIVPVEDNYVQRKKEYVSKENELKEVTDNKKKALIKAKEAETIYLKETSSEMTTKRKSYIEELSRLRSLIEKVKRIETITSSINKTEIVLKEIDKEKEKNTTFISSSNLIVEELRIKSTQSKEAEVTAGVIREELRKTKDIGNKLNKVLELQSTLNEKNKDYNTQKELLKELGEKVKINNESYKNSKADFQKNQAAVLAKDLNEGEPCPVCGSTHHAELAVFSKEPITGEVLEELEKTLKKYEGEYNEKNREMGILEERINKLNTDCNELIEELSGVISIKKDEILSTFIIENTTKLAELSHEVATLEELAKTYETIIKEVNKLSGDIKKAEEKNIELSAKYLETSNKLTEEKADIKGIFEDVPEQIRDSIKLTDTIKGQEKLQLESDERLINARRIYEDAKEILVTLKANEIQLIKDKKVAGESLETAKINLEKKIIESEFSDNDDYKNAKLMPEEMNDFKNQIEQHSKDLHSLKEQLKELTNQTKDIKEIVLTVFDEQINKLRIENTELTDKRSVTINRISNNKKILNEIETINVEIGDKETVYKVIGNLAKVAGGNNPSRITFERYVLAAFLEDIITAANIRLYKMTGGRYKLSRTEELQRSNAKGGLELEVHDGFTGKSRHVKTLSGGESFKASLSMALGLADVVQSYAGGVQLDTMFIDEGFGTLDQESLDSAISCLIDLQKTGRLVGIISHVQELKERIDTRLEVSSSSFGSETRFVVG